MSKHYIKKVLRNNKRVINSPDKTYRILEAIIKNEYFPKDTTNQEDSISQNTIGFKSIKPSETIDTFIKKTSRYLKKDKFNYILKVDIKKFYDSIDTNILLEKLRKFMDIKALDICKDTILKDGLATGSTLSPLFADIYLNDILSKINNLTYIRYVDDFLFFAQSIEEANKIKDKIERYLDTIGLKLNDKFYIRCKNDKKNLFLGFNFYYCETEDRVIFKCKKRKTKKIEQIYKDYYNKILYYYKLENESKLKSTIGSMNYYTVNLCRYYKNKSTNIQHDFKFSNKIINKIGDILGLSRELIKASSSKELFYRTESITSDKTNISLFVFN